jgi:hypothetical protein
MNGLRNPFSGSETEIEKTITEKYYNSRKEVYDQKFEEEQSNEYYTLLKHKETSMGTLVRKKFEGYFPKQ